MAVLDDEVIDTRPYLFIYLKKRGLIEFKGNFQSPALRHMLSASLGLE